MPQTLVRTKVRTDIHLCPLNTAGMRNEHPSTASERWLLPAAEVAKLLDISERHLWGLHKDGSLPAPVRLGRSVRWRAEDLRAWLAAGSPSRADWERMQEASHEVS